MFLFTYSEVVFIIMYFVLIQFNSMCHVQQTFSQRSVGVTSEAETGPEPIYMCYNMESLAWIINNTFSTINCFFKLNFFFQTVFSNAGLCVFMALLFPVYFECMHDFFWFILSWSYLHPCFSDVVVPDGWVSLALKWSTLVSRRDCEVFLKRSCILPEKNPFAVAGQSHFPRRSSWPALSSSEMELWLLHHLACVLLYNLPLLCIALLNELLQASAAFTDLGSRATAKSLSLYWTNLSVL